MLVGHLQVMFGRYKLTVAHPRGDRLQWELVGQFSADQVILTKMIERQLTEGSAHFREQAEAWLADVLGEEAAALMVDRPRG